MKHIKKILSAITALTLILSMHSGCGMFTNYKAIAEQALEDKYGEEFICYSTWDEGDFYYAKLSPAYDDGMKFYAGIDLKDKEAYYDTYTEAIVEKQIADIVYEQMADVWTDFCVHVTINGQGIDIYNKDDITIASYYNMIDYNMGYEINIDIAVNKSTFINENPTCEYEKYLNISEVIGVDDIYISVYFLDSVAYQEYKNWFYSTHNIYLGGFKDRDDFKKKILIHINCISQEYTLSIDEYLQKRKEH